MRKYKAERTSIINAINLNLLPDDLPVSDEITAYQQAYLAGGITDQELLDYMVSTTGITGETIVEIMKQTDNIYHVRASMAVDNLFSSPESMAIDELIIAGKMTTQEALANLLKKYKKTT
jgi:hypothetical protein